MWHFVYKLSSWRLCVWNTDWAIKWDNAHRCLFHVITSSKEEVLHVQWLQQRCICSVHVYQTEMPIQKIQHEYMCSYTLIFILLKPLSLIILLDLLFSIFLSNFYLFIFSINFFLFFLFWFWKLFSHIKLIESDSKDIYNVRNISISNKFCSFELSITKNPEKTNAHGCVMKTLSSNCF